MRQSEKYSDSPAEFIEGRVGGQKGGLHARLGAVAEEEFSTGRTTKSAPLQTPQGCGTLKFKIAQSLAHPPFVLTIGPVGRFARSKQIASYLGLNPSEHSSGGKRRLGAISKQGNTMVRWLLIEAAHQRCVWIRDFGGTIKG